MAAPEGGAQPGAAGRAGGSAKAAEEGEGGWLSKRWGRTSASSGRPPRAQPATQSGGPKLPCCKMKKEKTSSSRFERTPPPRPAPRSGEGIQLVVSRLQPQLAHSPDRPTTTEPATTTPCTPCTHSGGDPVVVVDARWRRAPPPGGDPRATRPKDHVQGHTSAFAPHRPGSGNPLTDNLCCKPGKGGDALAGLGSCTRRRSSLHCTDGRERWWVRRRGAEAGCTAPPGPSRSSGTVYTFDSRKVFHRAGTGPLQDCPPWQGRGQPHPAARAAGGALCLAVRICPPGGGVGPSESLRGRAGPAPPPSLFPPLRRFPGVICNRPRVDGGRGGRGRQGTGTGYAEILTKTVVLFLFQVSRAERREQRGIGCRRPARARRTTLRARRLAGAP